MEDLEARIALTCEAIGAEICLLEAASLEGEGSFVAENELGQVVDDVVSPTLGVLDPPNGVALERVINFGGDAFDDTIVAGIDIVIYNSDLETYDGTEFTSDYTRVYPTLFTPNTPYTFWTTDYSRSRMVTIHPVSQPTMQAGMLRKVYGSR